MAEIDESRRKKGKLKKKRMIREREPSEDNPFFVVRERGVLDHSRLVKKTIQWLGGS